MTDFSMRTIDLKNIDLIRNLWQRLNADHAALSPHFKDHFLSMTFEKRTKEFQAKAARGEVRIVICSGEKADDVVGYCVSNIIDGVGEIDSLYVEEDLRGSGVGSRLAQAAIDWMRLRHVEKITVCVSVGNERALAFYGRLGLLPRLFLLTNKQ